jgi:D-alanine transaminase
VHPPSNQNTPVLTDDAVPTVSAPIVYLNGEYLPLDQARISVMDRGFLFGDGVYEVIPVYDRQPFRLDAHLHRLQQSLEGIRLNTPLDDITGREPIQQIVADIVAQAPWPDMGIYLQITRGPGPRDHAFPNTPQPTLFLMPLALGSPSAAILQNGVAAITAVDNRWLRCNLKTTSLLANVLLRQLSVDAECAETILLREGWLTEGSASSVFLVHDGVIQTPPESELMLPGITYEILLELARCEGMPHQVCPISEEVLRKADEIWITSSTKEILAVTRLDDHPVGSGQPGPVYRRMLAAYQHYKRTVMRGHTA